MSDVEVSVIVPARNAAKTIGEQLDALAAQETERSWELIVVDNDSDDDTFAVVESCREAIPHLTIIKATERSGPSYARNVGVEQARGELLLFCDADDVVTAGWIDGLADGLKDYDAVGGPLDEETLNPGPTRALRQPLVTDHLPRVLGFPRAVTSNFALRAAVFRDLGGFDETYPASVDTEFSMRLQVAGYRLGYVGGAVVQYRHGDDVRAILGKIYRWNVVRPRLYKQYREHGATRQLWRGPAKWAWLVVCSFYLLGPRHKRLRWLAVATQSYGRMVGSIRHRTPVL